MNRCKKCGSVFFKAEQVCTVRHDVVVNGENRFIADIDGTFDPFETERPEGPYTCMECGTKYEDLTGLKDAPAPDGYAKAAHAIWEDAAAMRAGSMDTDELEAAYRKQELYYRMEDVRECFKELYGKEMKDDACKTAAIDFIDHYDCTVPEDVQIKAAVKKAAGREGVA